MQLTVYLAFENFEADLEKEIRLRGLDLLEKRDKLFLVKGDEKKLVWAQSIWPNCQKIAITSIQDGVRKLKAEKPLWALYSTACHRRAQLIQSELKIKKRKNLGFMEPLSTHRFGGWTLWSEHEILFSKDVSDVIPLNEIVFEETELPPSRAYLKIWEVLTCHVTPPKSGASVIEMGASPGGWTWVFEKMGLKIYAFDRSPLTDELMKKPRIQFSKTDIFKLQPKDYPKVEWLFSDVIAYPQKLYDLVLKWLDEKPNLNIVLTIKFQGPTDFDILDKYAAIPGARLVHLYNNKHEVTFIKTN